MQMKYKSVNEVIQWLSRVGEGEVSKTIYIHDDVRTEMYVSEHQFKHRLFNKCTLEYMDGKVWAIHAKE